LSYPLGMMVGWRATQPQRPTETRSKRS
jgi:hypothetical protein